MIKALSLALSLVALSAGAVTNVVSFSSLPASTVISNADGLAFYWKSNKTYIVKQIAWSNLVAELPAISNGSNGNGSLSIWVTNMTFVTNTAYVQSWGDFALINGTCSFFPAATTGDATLTYGYFGAPGAFTNNIWEQSWSESHDYSGHNFSFMVPTNATFFFSDTSYLLDNVSVGGFTVTVFNKGSGINGTNGAPGINGTNGAPGINGTNGAPGINVTNGAGFFPSLTWGIGHSICDGWGSSCPDPDTISSNAYMYVLTAALGSALSNQYATPAATIQYLSYNIFYAGKAEGAPVIKSNNACVFDIGVNDWGNDTNGFLVTTFGEMELAQLGWLSFMDSEKQITGGNFHTGANTTNGFLTGNGWGKYDTSYFVPMTVDWATTNIGDSVTITNVYGPDFILGYEAWTTNNAGSTFQVWIDGSLARTISSSCLPFTGGFWAWPNAIVATTFNGLSAGYHTISITNLGGATSGSNYFGFAFALFPAMQTFKVHVMDVGIFPSYLDPEYGSPGLAIYNAAKRANVTTLANLGEPIKYIPTARLIQNSDICSGPHPNQSGHAKIAGALYMAFTMPFELYNPLLEQMAAGNGADLTNLQASAIVGWPLTNRSYALTNNTNTLFVYTTPSDAPWHEYEWGGDIYCNTNPTPAKIGMCVQFTDPLSIVRSNVLILTTGSGLISGGQIIASNQYDGLTTSFRALSNTTITCQTFLNSGAWPDGPSNSASAFLRKVW